MKESFGKKKKHLVSVYLDIDTIVSLSRACSRSSRSRTKEISIRLHDHLKRYPDFYSSEILNSSVSSNVD
ncbi:TraY domain-containing protein [Pectobacterium aroidearum]|uniref:TraY domain-containing protein n=1 Tax=Pectobacterium aroidearum TaxID=1201031 RepID=UPI0030173ADD